MKTLILISCLFLNLKSAYSNVLSPKRGCPITFTKVKDILPWESSGKCVAKENVISNMVKYIEACGLIRVGASEWDEAELQNLVRLFEYNTLYNRYFLKHKSYLTDLRNEISNSFSDEKGWEGIVLLYRESGRRFRDIYVTNETFLFPSCSGRIGEVSENKSETYWDFIK